MTVFGRVLPPLFKKTGIKPFSAIRHLTRNMADPAPAPAPWYAGFPEPKTSPVATIPREEVLGILKNEDLVPGKDYVLVDLRRNDFEVSIPSHGLGG